jgi:hypothetical protein
MASNAAMESALKIILQAMDPHQLFVSDRKTIPKLH